MSINIDIDYKTNMNEVIRLLLYRNKITIAELARLKKAVILVPFERLPGGHQLKNAERLQSADAVVMLKDSDMMADHTKLLEEIRHLVKSPRQRADMADRLSKEARSDAAKRLADIILEEA